MDPIIHKSNECHLNFVVSKGALSKADGFINRNISVLKKIKNWG